MEVASALTFIPPNLHCGKSLDEEDNDGEKLGLDREDWEDALIYDVKYTEFNGSVKFNLQLINPNELPDQIRLRLACILH